MASQELDSIAVTESYEASNGSKKTRTTTIRSMDNNGSQFINIHSGRGSVCISKDIATKVANAITSLKWKSASNKDAKIAELEKLLKELKGKK